MLLIELLKLPILLEVFFYFSSMSLSKLMTLQNHLIYGNCCTDFYIFKCTKELMFLFYNPPEKTILITISYKQHYLGNNIKLYNKMG